MSIHVQSHYNQPLSNLNNFPYFIVLFSSLLFISPCRKLWLPNFLWYASFQKFNPNMTPMNISDFLRGGCIPSLGTRKHLIACNLELVQVHRNTWAVSWACKLHLLGGSHRENWGCKYFVVHIHIYLSSEYIHLGETSRNVWGTKKRGHCWI